MFFHNSFHNSFHEVCGEYWFQCDCPILITVFVFVLYYLLVDFSKVFWEFKYCVLFF